MELITSNSNANIKHISKLMKDKKYRLSSGLLVCEGHKMLLEAVSAGVLIDTLILSEKYSDLDVLANKKLLANIKLSDTKTPQGIIFSCFKKIYNVDDIKEYKKIIILDSVADPGNMGTIIRSANAFNIDCIILVGDCVDITNMKVVRSTMGAIFKIPIYNLTYEECFEHVKVPIYATCLSEKSKDIREISLKSSAVIIGNEANGVSDISLEYAEECIIIPICDDMESLNASVATSIIMWEMTK